MSERVEAHLNPYLTKRSLQPMLSIRLNFLNRNHFALLCGAAQHNTSAAVANELARAEILREDKAVLWPSVSCFKWKFHEQLNQNFHKRYNEALWLRG
jgi:hypothetical protein